MNIPNRLSIIRICCVPFMVVFLTLPYSWCRWAALAIFLIASFTDYLDGHIARSRNLITDFGKFIDPLADKLLVLSALIMLLHLRLVPGWFVVVILARELSVDGLRLVAAGKGKVIAAGKAGKLKTLSQMVLIIYLMVTYRYVFQTVPGIILAAWVVIITVYSGVEYFLKNLPVFEDN